jgi:flagellar biosynthesis regulator FlaF
MRIPFFAVTTAAAVLAGAMALRAEPAPEQIDLSQFPAAAVQDVVVPVPSEIFNVLDKLGSPNWKGELRDSLGKQSGNRAQVALLLGTVIAEGFIAVEAEDSERVKEIGRDVLELSRAIGVEKAVVTRSKAIVDKADARDWNGTRRELDGALQDVRSAMNELNDEDLAQLVSLGGWVRGTEVLTSIVQKDYKPARAELLHQPELLNYFNRRLDDMSPRLRKSALVTQLKSMLEEIRPLILQGEGRKISPESVERIHTVTSKMVVTITATDA